MESVWVTLMFEPFTIYIVRVAELGDFEVNMDESKNQEELPVIDKAMWELDWQRTVSIITQYLWGE